MKRLLATTAIALLAAGPVLAQEQPPAAPAAGAEVASPGSDAGTLFLQSQEPTDFLGSELIGLDVVSSQDEYQTGTPTTLDARAAWDDIGDVGDLLISATGEVRAVLVDVGGFLGMGTHTVALDMNAIHVLTDETGARFVAINSSQEALEAAPAFEPLPAPGAEPAAGDTMGAAPEATGTMATEPAPADTMAAGDAPRDAFVPLAAAELTAERLEGATVYSQADESIGDISQLNLDPDGKITEAIVDVGGFLGMGEHRVAIAFDEMNVVNDPETGDVRVYIDTTREDLEQRPEYQG
jgi:PRC-barrel domain